MTIYDDWQRTRNYETILGNDAPLELLLLIPPEPGFVPFTDLRIVFKVGHDFELFEILNLLRYERGVPVETFRLPNGAGRAARIKRAAWPMARVAADRYYKETYGDHAPIVGATAGTDARTRRTVAGMAPSVALS